MPNEVGRRGRRTLREAHRGKLASDLELDDGLRHETTEEELLLPQTLVPGAVAVIDALGFRDIWRRHEPVAILGVLARLQEAARYVADLHSVFSEVLVHSAAFSDTIILAALPRQDSTSGDAVRALAHTVARLAVRATAREPRLLYRGCIAVGQLAFKGSSFVGPAIDEAAEWYERADAAVVWLTPSAVATQNRHDPVLGLFEWEVPLKNAASLRTLVVNPLTLQVRVDPTRLKDLADRYLAAFGESSRVDVEVKRQQTSRLLSAAIEHCEAFVSNEIEEDEENA